MRLATFAVDGDVRCGVVSADGGTVTELTHALGLPPGPLDDVLARRELFDAAIALGPEELARGTAHAVDQVRLCSPVTRPSKVLVAGANTWSHLTEAGLFTEDNAPRRPMVLSKPPSAVTGPHDAIVRPAGTTQLDYEVELAVIIGRRCRNVSPQDVDDVIAGYTVANDVSARDVQLSVWEDNTFYRTHYLGKGADTFCPLGPWLVTADELPEVVELRSFVNGELRQRATLDDLIFGVAQLVSFVSDYMTLEPGDVFLTGSPAGVGYFMEPPGFVQPGDHVVCEIDGIGRIANPIAAEASR